MFVEDPIGCYKYGSTEICSTGQSVQDIGNGFGACICTEPNKFDEKPDGKFDSQYEDDSPSQTGDSEEKIDGNFDSQYEDDSPSQTGESEEIIDERDELETETNTCETKKVWLLLNSWILYKYWNYDYRIVVLKKVQNQIVQRKSFLHLVVPFEL